VPGLLNLGSGIRREEAAVQAGTQPDGLTIAGARARYAGVAILALKKPCSCSCPVVGGAVSGERTRSFNDAARRLGGIPGFAAFRLPGRRYDDHCRNTAG
jgi:hypothetical protein